MFVQADALKAAADRLTRARLEWTEDTITAGLLARLPVSHIRTTQLADGGTRDDVVLAGGHVFASRVFGRAPRPTRTRTDRGVAAHASKGR